MSQSAGEIMNPLGIALLAGIVLLVVFAFIDRIWVPFQARRSVEKILKNKTDYDPRTLENSKYGSVDGDAERLRITTQKGDSSELRWSEIEEVHAFKRDLGTTDLICLAFKKSGREEYHEVHEEMAGYHDLLKVLPSRLPGFTMEWLLAVGFPAFETKRQIVWKTSPNQPDIAPPA